LLPVPLPIRRVLVEYAIDMAIQYSSEDLLIAVLPTTATRVLLELYGPVPYSGAHRQLLFSDPPLLGACRKVPVSWVPIVPEKLTVVPYSAAESAPPPAVPNVVWVLARVCNPGVTAIYDSTFVAVAAQHSLEDLRLGIVIARSPTFPPAYIDVLRVQDLATTGAEVTYTWSENPITRNYTHDLAVRRISDPQSTEVIYMVSLEHISALVVAYITVSNATQTIDAVRRYVAHVFGYPTVMKPRESLPLESYPANWHRMQLTCFPPVSDSEGNSFVSFSYMMGTDISYWQVYHIPCWDDEPPSI